MPVGQFSQINGLTTINKKLNNTDVQNLGGGIILFDATDTTFYPLLCLIKYVNATSSLIFNANAVFIRNIDLAEFMLYDYSLIPSNFNLNNNEVITLSNPILTTGKIALPIQLGSIQLSTNGSYVDGDGELDVFLYGTLF